MQQQQLEIVYQRLYRAYGPQHWWPGDTPFEVMIGAVLTQNTAWPNVEKAIANLKAADCFDAEKINKLSNTRLAELIRPSGYFNIKAKRLKNLCCWIIEQDGIETLSRLDTAVLRDSLLAINGVGPETADDILLYGFQRPVFVIDTYTRRLFSRFSLIKGDEHYETLRGWFEAALEPDVLLYNEYHALIVRHAKEKCTENSHCVHCQVEADLES